MIEYTAPLRWGSGNILYIQEDKEGWCFQHSTAWLDEDDDEEEDVEDDNDEEE